MNREEIVKLRRSSLLALKAYFSVSMSQGWEDLLNGVQMQAAYFMHQAACAELQLPDNHQLPPRVQALLLDVVGDLADMIAVGKTDGDILKALRTKIESIIGVEQADDQTGGNGKGGNPP
jgi:hypothetical protein